MLIRSRSSIQPSEITPREVFLSRRQLVAGAAGLAAAAMLPQLGNATPLTATKSPFSTDEPVTSLKDATSYNNFYEFGTDKEDPASNAGSLKTRPWAVKVDGLVGKPAEYQLEDFIKPFALEERIYRMRCVEGWSMVIPWTGFPLAEVLKRAEPQSSAKFVAFETLLRPEEMPGQSAFFPVLDWPYVEGLRLDEAMHPLTILAVGAYGETLPNQSGAPIRLVVPWKYGFKGIKSIVRISLVDSQPRDLLEQAECERVRLLFQRQSAGRSPALEPGDRAPHRGRQRPPRQAAADPDVQRLWRPGGGALCRHGPQGQFLMALPRARRPVQPRLTVPDAPLLAVYAVGLLPAAYLFFLGFTDSDRLGADPLNSLEHSLGLWALRFLIATLCVTPLRTLGVVSLIRYRRAFGLLAFYYAMLHLGVWLVLDRGLDWHAIIADVLRRPYVTIGMVSFAAMVPLALTSTNRSIRLIGAAAWNRLHKLVYLAAAAAALHFVMVVKSWPAEPLVYAGIVAALLCYRGYRKLRAPAGGGRRARA